METVLTNFWNCQEIKSYWEQPHPFLEDSPLAFVQLMYYDTGRYEFTIFRFTKEKDGPYSCNDTPKKYLETVNEMLLMTLPATQKIK